ncbi:MAG TPA: NAD(P)H-hydrate dehydratase [Acidimicrobiales bacterium]|nr:NAD(P)H-hydrate dehydratase [Acidimicrobiales bacterium]
MLPVLTPDEMREVDATAPEPVAVLVERAGAATARAALQLLRDRTGGVYGRRVVVVAGPGNNGADGRSAARRLAGRGAAVAVVAPGDEVPDGADLLVDAAYGTGLSRRYAPAAARAVAVLAVDIPSGLSGRTGTPVDGSTPLQADATVTFAAWKPGLLLGDGPDHAGEVALAGIGLDTLAGSRAGAWLVTDGDVADLVAPRPREAHKWQTALQVVAGSPGMTGAPWMVARAAMRAGAGYVRLGIPGTDPIAAGLPPGELVGRALPADPAGWPAAVLDGIDRVQALVVGPGLGSAGRGADGATGAATPVAALLTGAPATPAVVDADGLNALGDADAVARVVAARRAPTVLTPHAGEYARLFGGPPGDDRLAAVRHAADRTGAVVLLKGSTTVVAAPGGRVLLAASGSSRLATAGTGDVLAGVIGALLARGVAAPEAAALGAHVHGRAAGLGFAEGLVATDLPDLVATWLSRHAGGS